MARSTAPLFGTGSTPGSARSIAQACVFGAAPNAVAAPEKIFDDVDSCACVSRPMTVSHFMANPPHRGRPATRRCQSVACWNRCATFTIAASAK